MEKTLVLNSRGQPHAIVGWQDAICMIYQEKVIVMEEYDEIVESPSLSYFIPAVMQLRRATAGEKRGVKFSRINIFTRDGFRCCYCGEQRPMKSLNYDHVIPRRQGGKTVWENIVTCCYPCNEKKRDRTPEQAGMTLLRKPVKPNALPLHAVYVDQERIPEAWEPYLSFENLQQHGKGTYVVRHTDKISAQASI